jgi:alkylated DNA nucleotide flippase Atl1
LPSGPGIAVSGEQPLVVQSVDERVCSAVREVPDGCVTTYGDIARRLGLKTPRQVGAILARGHDDVPWHRVIRSDGRLVDGLRDEQCRLLRSEGVEVTDYRVELRTYRW